MTSQQRLTHAKSQLLITHPYFGFLATRLVCQESDRFETFASNGKTLYYHPDYFERCSSQQLKALLANAVMHHVLAHQQRKNKRRNALWQMATDFAINSMLIKNGFHLPPDARYDPTFDGLYAEEIYTQLQESSQTSSAPWDEEAHSESEEPEDHPQISQMSEDDEESWHYAQALALQSAASQGKRPLGLERLAPKQEPSRHDWRFELFNAINHHLCQDYTLIPPNKKFLWQGVYLPALQSQSVALCVAIDTSGSINETLLGFFMSEFEAIMEAFPSVSIDLLIADAVVHHHYTFQSGDRLDYKIKGGGGTDFRVVFDYIDEYLPMTTFLLYFTDGEGRFPIQQPMYEVLWALSHPARTPFGRVLHLF